ncbi:MAG: hypothetical protein DIU83_08775 [Bacillota bacterium]|nr:MAG: hypothetical protein DIU83_08775 [Bacillota bacterium]
MPYRTARVTDGAADDSGHGAPDDAGRGASDDAAHGAPDGGVAGVETLTVAPGVLEAIVDHGRREYPREACGIVAGRDGRAQKVYPLANVASDPVRRYLIDAGQQRAALAAMRAEGQEPVAVFHSHPRTAAAPSGVDVDLAYHPELVYIIVSLAFDPPEVRAYRIDREARRVSPVALQVPQRAPGQGEQA